MLTQPTGLLLAQEVGAMVRWWTLSVMVAVGAVLFGFDGITAGPRVLAAIAFVASFALLAAMLAEVVTRRARD